MENPTPTPPPSPSVNPPAKDAINAQRLADSLASKHAAAAGGSGPGPRPRGGRKSRAEEIEAFLRANNLRTIPLGAESTPPVNSERAFAVDPAFVRKLAETALKGIEAWRQREAYNLALMAGIEKSEARIIGEQNGAPPGGIEVFSDAFAEFTQKYDWINQWTPELAMTVCAVTWFIKDAATIKRLAAIAADNENRNNRNPNGPS